MDFIDAIKMVYEKDAVIKRMGKYYCIYKSQRTDCLRKLSFNKTKMYVLNIIFMSCNINIKK